MGIFLKCTYIGALMIYRLVLNYFWFKALRIIVSRIMGSKLVTPKNMKTMSLLTYGLEVLVTFYLNGKRKPK